MFLGRLYPNLDTLVEKGLVKKGEKDHRTNVYTVTKCGQRVLEAWRDWERQYVDYNSYRAISLQSHSGQESWISSKLVPQDRHSNSTVVSVELGDSRFRTRNIETHCGSTTSWHSGHSAQTPPAYSIRV